MPEPTKKRLSAEKTALMRVRSSWDPHWQDLADNFAPRSARFSLSDKNRGTKMNKKIINNAGTMALRGLSSGLMAGLTSPARPWFRLTTGIPGLMEQFDVRAWLNKVERLMREVLARSNVYRALPRVYFNEALYGTSPMFVEEDEDSVIHCSVLPIGSYALGTNQKGKVNRVFRNVSLTVDQLEKKFGLDKLSNEVRSLHMQGHLHQEIAVVHVIEPNDTRIPEREDATGMPWRSIWYEDNKNTRGLLGVGGFREFPVMAPRWDVEEGDTYGGSPAMDALGDVRQLQHMEKKRGQLLDKMVHPPVQSPGVRKSVRASLLPGAVTYLGAMAGLGKIEPLHTVDARGLQQAEDILRVEGRINEALYKTLFLMLSQGRRAPQKTAREVDELHEEKILQLGPALESQEDELLDPFIDRLFEIMNRNGMIPPPPSQLEGSELRVEYISVLAQAQKMLGLVSVEKIAQFIVELSQFEPAVLDKFNFDRAVDEYSLLVGTNPELIRSDDDVQQIRTQRAEQQQQAEQQQAEAQALRDAGAGAKSLAEAQSVDGGSSFQQLLEASGASARAAA